MSQANSNTYPIRSRRAVLAGLASAVALPIAAAIPTAAPAMSPVKQGDAELLDLVEQFIVAEAEYCRLNIVFDRMDCVGFDVQPTTAMQIRSGDAALGIPQPDQREPCRVGFYDGTAVATMREQKWIDRASSSREDDETLVITVRYIAQSAEARARADEIVEAYDKYRKERDRKPRGYRAAERARDKVYERSSKLEEQVAEISATTIQGLIAKARCAEILDFEGDVDRSIVEDLLALQLPLGPGKAME